MEDEKIINLWQTAVEMANSISCRRDTMNNIFITFNLGIITAVFITLNYSVIILSVLGIVISGLWLKLIENYRILNRVKFEVIHILEEKMKYEIFKLEWEKLQNLKGYKDSSEYEKLFPWCFIIINTLILLYYLHDFFCFIKL